MLPFHTILHPTDFSKHSDYALQVASSLARDYGARLIILHVLHGAEPPAWLYDRMAGSSPWTDDCHYALEERLRPLRESNPELGIDIRAVEGSPAVEILRVANEDGCDLIVMGTKGMTRLDRVLVGSVAEEVMRKAVCPVLSMRDPQTAPALELSVDGRYPAVTTAMVERVQ